ncbi:MAG: class I tRNA ligase family protein, partial [Candidatus Omnitrophica bacterium]|nr:class I tRNA ligase family protein [Candidatus Omnitrophota bacterium]
LANDLGNLLHRTLSMIDKYCSGIVPERRDIGLADDITKAMAEKAGKIEHGIRSAMDKMDFSRALAAIWELINTANKFIEQKAPWKLSKAGKTDELKDMMYDLYEVLRIVSVALWPFMPSTAEEMTRQLGLPEAKAELKYLSWGLARSGTKINKGNPLFPRIED